MYGLVTIEKVINKKLCFAFYSPHLNFYSIKVVPLPGGGGGGAIPGRSKANLYTLYIGVIKLSHEGLWYFFDKCYNSS